MYDPVLKQLYARAIGELVVQHLDTVGAQELARLAQGEAVKLICRIREILDDPTLQDGECFQRIDAIVSAFHAAGIPTRRHGECE